MQSCQRFQTISFSSFCLQTEEYKNSEVNGKMFITEKIKFTLKYLKKQLKQYNNYCTIQYGYNGKGIDRELVITIENFNNGITEEIIQEIFDTINYIWRNTDKCKFITLPPNNKDTFLKVV